MTKCVRCDNGDSRTPDGFHALSTGRFSRCANLPIWQPTSDGGMEEVKPGQWYDIGRYVELEDYERLRAAHAESERQLREWQDRCARAESPDETKAPPSRAAYDARGDYIRELQEALSQLWSDVWVGGGYRAPTKEKVLAALKVQPASSVQETTARQVFNHERDCGLTDDVGTCECPQKAGDEPPVIGSGAGTAPMPTTLDAIAAHVREIQILCDASGVDPTEFLSDTAAGGCL